MIEVKYGNVFYANFFHNNHEKNIGDASAHMILVVAGTPPGRAVPLLVKCRRCGLFSTIEKEHLKRIYMSIMPEKKDSKLRVESPDLKSFHGCCSADADAVWKFGTISANFLSFYFNLDTFYDNMTLLKDLKRFDIVSYQFGNLLQHYAIFVSDSEFKIIHQKKNYLLESSLEADHVLSQRKLRLAAAADAASLGFEEKMRRELRLHDCMLHLSENFYHDFLNFNCEHPISFVNSGQVRSKEVESDILLFTLIAVVFVLVL